MYATTQSILDAMTQVEDILKRRASGISSELRQLWADRDAVRQGNIIHPNWEDYGAFVTQPNGLPRLA